MLISEKEVVARACVRFHRRVIVYTNLSFNPELLFSGPYYKHLKCLSTLGHFMWQNHILPQLTFVTRWNVRGNRPWIGPGCRGFSLFCHLFFHPCKLWWGHVRPRTTASTAWWWALSVDWNKAHVACVLYATSIQLDPHIYIAFQIFN